MLDFHQAVAQLGGAWDIYVVSIANEVKELLLLSSDIRQIREIRTEQSSIRTIHAVSLNDQDEHIFSFTLEEEAHADVQYVSQSSLCSLSASGLCSLSSGVPKELARVGCLAAVYFLHRTGEKSSRTVNISKRPMSMTAVITHLATTGKLA